MMKHLKYFLLFFSFTLYSQNISLEECYTLAKQNYPLIQRNNLITKSKEYNLENAGKAWLPQINLGAQASYQSDVTSFPNQTTSGGIEPLSKDQYKVYADINQTIYDGGMIANQKKMATQQAEMELTKNEMELDQLEKRINQLYFGILQTQEQIQQINITKSDVQNGLKKAEAQLKNGVIFRSNVDILKAQLITLDQKNIALQSIKKSYLQMLSLFVGKDLDSSTLLSTPEKILISDQNNRSELKLFDIQKEYLETQKSFIKSKNLPKLSLFGQVGYGKPGFNMLKNEFDDFYIGGLRLNIPISGFYTKKNDLSLIEFQQQDVEIQRETFLFNQNFTTVQEQNDLLKILQLLDQDDELIALRTSIKKASLAQLENGVITTSDYLREVNAEDQARTQKVQHEIQYLLTQYNLKTLFNN